MINHFKYDVFLSHNSNDKPQVRQLAERLRDAGLRVWFDEWVIKPGDDIYLAIERGLEVARVQVLCLSPNALESDWVMLERCTVLFRDPSNKGRRFIPLLLADCELPDTLRRYKYVDFREGTKTAFDELLVVCQSESSPPAIKKLEEKTHQLESLAVFERKLTELTNRVYGEAVSPDGTWVASGSDGNTVKKWNITTGKCRATLSGHAGDVYSIAITSDGTRILSSSRDRSVRVWDAKTGQELLKLDGHTEEVLSVAVLSDNIHAISGGSDRTLKLWDLSSGDCLNTIQCNDNVYCVAVNQSGTQALSGHGVGKLKLWDLKTNECLAILRGHTGIVRSVQITRDGRCAVSGSEDRTIKIWDLIEGVCIGTLEGHQSDVFSVSFSPDGTLIASSGFSDSTVRLWNWKSGTCLQVIENAEPWAPVSAVFSPDGLRLVVGTSRQGIFVYRLTGVHPASPPEVPRRYVNAKVVLLGEGTVGKTSLAHRLVEDKYVVRDRTHGMNVWRLDVPLPPDVNLEREALLWDLAGQEDYRLIHQLFLEETALALLLVNPQKDDPFVEAGDWLKALKTATGNKKSKCEASRLLIFSQIDVGGMKLGSSKIERFCEQYDFAEWLSTSAKTGENCSDEKNDSHPSKLKQLIAKSIPWDRLPWTSTPRLLAELKDSMVVMRDQEDIRLLRFAELMQRLKQACPEEIFDESDVRTAVMLLANHGLARQLNFGDLVLLRPELINGYAGAIIRVARAHTDEIGCVLEADIYRPNFDFTGVERLMHHADEELLLRALVQTFLDHSLCIAEETPQGRHLVFPSQYRREKEIPYEPSIFVSYTFNGEWQTVWTTLVVRLWYSNEFDHRELWRNAAEFSSSKGHLLGLKIDNQQGEGTGTISLYFDKEVPDELKTILIEYVHRHLASYGCNVTRDRRYVCPNCGKPVYDHDEVRKRLTANKDFIYCQGCDEKVPLIDFIEQRLKSDPVARKILAMEEMATRKLDTQALEQILIGHMMAISGEANQVFRPVSMFDYGIDGEVEFRDDDGKLSGRKIYVQLKSGNSYLRTRKADGREVFRVANARHIEYWVNQPVDVYLVIRQTDEMTGSQDIRWMNVTHYLKKKKCKTKTSSSKKGKKKSQQIIFDGEKLDLEAVWKVRDELFLPVSF